MVAIVIAAAAVLETDACIARRSADGRVRLSQPARPGGTATIVADRRAWHSHASFTAKSVPLGLSHVVVVVHGRVAVIRVTVALVYVVVVRAGVDVLLGTPVLVEHGGS